MCGIAGIAAVRHAVSDATNKDHLFDVREPLKRMVHQLRHRGPDDEGTLFINSATGDLTAGFGHTRLSILDLSAAGHQPMCAVAKANGARGEHVNAITFNGEIYNFQQLRAELDAEHPHEWKSGSDTEALLRAYQCWGVAMLGKLRGMFAFALWDGRKQELLLARDHYGIKPLYFYATKETLVFASEVRTLLTSELVPRTLDAKSVASFFRYGSVQSPLTLINNVRSLAPCSYLIVRRQDDELCVEEHSFSPQTQPDAPDTRDDAVGELRRQLEESVAAHLVSDVEVAAFLSGGIDSSAIVALMSQVSDERPRTFSVVFKEQEFSESVFAKAIAERYATRHTEVMLSSQQLLDLLPQALAAMDQPSMDGINTFVISQAVRAAGIKVALSGLGSDEIFAGYPSFKRAWKLRNLRRVPAAVRASAASVGAGVFNKSIAHRKAWKMIESGGDATEIYRVSRQLFAPEEVERLTGTSFDEDAASGEVFGVQANENDPINQVSRCEIGGYMLNTLLRDSDAMSMNHGLEVRVPFVDRRLVPFVLSLPGAWKFDGKRPKPLLLDALGDLLPEAIWRRPKMGFTLPFERWMQTTLRDEIEMTLEQTKHARHLPLGDYGGEVWAKFKATPRHERWSRSWSLYVFTKWCVANRVEF